MAHKLKDSVLLTMPYAYSRYRGSLYRARRAGMSRRYAISRYRPNYMRRRTTNIYWALRYRGIPYRRY